MLIATNTADGLYYANDTENHRIISFADLSSRTLTAQTKSIAGISLQRPHDIVLDPATGWIYAINPNSGHVFRFTAIGKNESAISVPVKGYARALTFANGKLYAIGSAKGRIVEIVDWDTPTFFFGGGRGWRFIAFSERRWAWRMDAPVVWHGFAEAGRF
ncbi:MAG: hypothetical protein P8O22_06205 [Akkermansiaceae bacterium]|nr:hypothetical protein [Akkermansiaceae bacterium]